MNAHDAFEAAAAIAFWFFLSIVPLLVIVGFLVAQVARSRGVDALVGPLLDVVPAAAEGIVRSEIERLAGGSVSSLAPLGVVGYLWTASSGLHNLMDVFESAVRVKRRPWWKQRVIALGWVVLGLASTCLLALVLVQMDSAFHWDDPPASPAGSAASVGGPSAPGAPRFPDRVSFPRARPPGGRLQGAFRHRVQKALHTPHEQVVAAVLMLAVGMSFLAGFYRFAVEHPPAVRRRVWPGTVTAVGCWLTVSWAFGAYVVSIADYALYYGSLAAVAVLLVWLYLTSLSLVVGAEVNGQLETKIAQRPVRRAH
jgi:membrane protein